MIKFRVVALSINKIEMNKIFSLLLIIICISCESSKNSLRDVFVVSKELQAQQVEFEIDSIQNPFLMRYVNGKLVVCNVFTSSLITVFDWKTGRYIMDFGDKGLGPNEFVNFNTMSVLGDKLGVYDNNKREFLFLSLNDSASISYTTIKMDEDDGIIPFNIYALAENLFLATGLIKKGRFALFNNEGVSMGTFGEYPKPDVTNIASYTENAFAYQALIAYQSNKKKLAVGNQFGEGISFYNMNNTLHPQLLKEYIMNPPHYIDTSKGDMKSVTFQKDNICGFVDIGASEKYCIGLFLGQARVKGEEWRGGDKLLIFDWNGNPVKEICLPQKYLQMSISEDKIILLGNDPKTIDFVVHTIDLSEI